MTHAINLVISVILTLVELVLEAIGVADGFLASVMTAAGLPANLQGAVLIVVALLLVLFAIRVLGGVFGAVLVVLLLLLIAHRLMPGMQMPNSVLHWQAGSVHI